MQERVIDVPLERPETAAGWGTVDWRLSPSDAHVEAELLAAEKDYLLAVVGRQPVRLRLRVYPSAAESVVLEEVEVGCVQDKE